MGLNLSNAQIAQELDRNKDDIHQMTTQLRQGLVDQNLSPPQAMKYNATESTSWRDAKANPTRWQKRASWPTAMAQGALEYDIYSRLPGWRYECESVCHRAGTYASDDDGDGFCEVHVNTMDAPLYLGFFEFVHNVRRRVKALLGTLLALLLT